MKGLAVPITHVEILSNVREMGEAAMARQKKAAANIKRWCWARMRPR